MGMSVSDFEEFVTARQQRLLGVAYLLTQDRQRAEDLLQDAFVKVYRRWRRDGVPAHSEAYLRRTLVNEFLSGRRKLSSTEIPVAQERLAEVPDTEAATDDRLLVWRALATLPPRQRAVLVLRTYEGLTDSQIGELLDCAEGSVRSLASRAYSTLRHNSQLLDRASAPTKE